MSERYVFRMRLKAGAAAEYQRRHKKIWPELVALLKDAGISEYSIHHDEETDLLIGILIRAQTHKMEDLPEHQVMQKWWTFMHDIMETHPDNSPVAVALPRLFYMP